MQAMKIRINNPDHSTKVQQALFDAGYSWAWPAHKNKGIYTWSGYLLADSDGIITHFGNREEDYINDPTPEYEFVETSNCLSKGFFRTLTLGKNSTNITEPEKLSGSVEKMREDILKVSFQTREQHNKARVEVLLEEMLQIVREDKFVPEEIWQELVDIAPDYVVE